MAGYDWVPGQAGSLLVAGKRLETLCHGPAPDGARPTIVLLHEGLGSVALWRDFPARLAEATGCGVFAWSRAGHGQSDPADLPRPLDYQTAEALGPLAEVLDALGQGPFILLGHSDGATMAAVYAGSRADPRVRGLVLIAPHFFTEPMGLASIAEARTAYEAGELRARMAKYHANPDNVFRGWNDVWLHPDFEAWNVAEVIDYIRVPVLAVQGVDDQYGTIAQIDEIVSRCYAPVDVEMIEGCRHSPHLEVPEHLVGLVAEFVARLRRIEAAGAAPV